jgi:hypothetical protein
MAHENKRIRAITDNAFGAEMGCGGEGCIYGYGVSMKAYGSCQCIKGDTIQLRRHLLRMARIARLALYVTRQDP